MHKWVSSPPTGRVFHSAIVTPLGRITWAGRHLDQSFVTPMRMRYWDTYSAVYVLKGQARFHDEAGLNLPARPGGLLLMFPRHGYRYVVAPDEPWSEFFIQFRGPLFGLWMKEGLLDPRRNNAGRRPLARRRRSLRDIARQCGFYDEYHFAKRLKALTGLTPAQYRKRML